MNNYNTGKIIGAKNQYICMDCPICKDIHTLVRKGKYHCKCPSCGDIFTIEFLKRRLDAGFAKMSKTSQEEFDDIFNELSKLRERKNQDYGDGFLKTYNQYGKSAAFFDMLRKWTRLENLMLNDRDNLVEDETLEDTLGDLAVMCINIMVWLRRQDG